MKKSLRVLIVEDSKNDAELIALEFRRGGYDVEWERVETSEGMIKALEKQNWDIIVSDYSMPHFSGLEALKLAHEKVPDISFIIISGTIGEDVAVEAMKLGAHDYIMKDKLMRLVPAVERELKDAEMRREKRKAEEAIQKSEEKYRTLTETMNDVVFILDKQCRFTFLNPKFEKVTDYLIQDFLGHSFTEIVAPEYIESTVEFFKQGLDGETIPLYEIEFVRKDGRKIPIELNVTSLFDANGQTIGRLGVARDITERKKAEEQIQKDLKEKTTLLQEIHHRVKNNLQVITSLLSQQSRKMTNLEGILALQESIKRVKSMSLIHEKFYQSKKLSSVNFKEYIRSLARDLFFTYHEENKQIELEFNLENIFLSIDSAIPCGLLVNELISNSFKHAFPESKTGKIKVCFTRLKDKSYSLIVQDNGVGISESIDCTNTNTMGLTLIDILAKQIEGSAKFESKNGTICTVNFMGYEYGKIKYSHRRR